MAVHTHIEAQLPRLRRDTLSASQRVPCVVSVLSCAGEALEVKKKNPRDDSDWLVVTSDSNKDAACGEGDALH